MRSNLFKALAVAVVSASCFGIVSTAALAEKSGGIMKTIFFTPRHNS